MESGSRPARLLTMKLWRRPQKSVGQKNNPPLSRLGIYSLSPSPQWGNPSVTEVVPITPYHRLSLAKQTPETPTSPPQSSTRLFVLWTASCHC